MKDFIKWTAAGLLFVFSLPGCLGVKPAVPTQFYLLNPVEYAAPLVQKANPVLSIEIRSLRLPQYLEKPQIVTRTSQNRLELAEYHQWAGNLRKNMTRVMARNLSNLLATPNVSIPPFHHSGLPDVRIETRVMAFEANALGQVVLTASWRLINGESGRVMDSGFSDFKTGSSGQGMEAIVAAMDEALGRFCLALGEKILTYSARGDQ